MKTVRGTGWVVFTAAFLTACTSGGSDPKDVGTDTPGTDVVVHPDLGPDDPGTVDDGLRDVLADADDAAADSEITDAEELCPPYAGAPSCPCKSPDDCLSSLCIDTMDGQQCTATCATSDPCPRGWYCGVVTGTGADLTYGCIDPFARLCQPCLADADCVPLLASTSYRYACVSYGRTGSFCGVSCAADTDCPDGFQCTEVTVGRGTIKQCRPADGAECPCTAKFQQQANQTECRVDNEFGSCLARRTCDIECPAATPAAETCNAVDDDCDGQTDEDLVEEACTLDNEWGSCPAKVACKDGKAKCTGIDPAQEACNGIDDNCDGSTDEEGALNCLSYIRDDDKDGQGVTGDTRCQCGPTPPYSATVDGDCNDANKQVFTGATEVCNDVDDNCNGATDEEGAQGCIPYYTDQDGDLYGVTAEMKCLCKAMGLFTARLPGDCSDLIPAINPAAVETCNSKDDDCDGTTDNAGAQNCSVFYMDADGDKYGKTDTYQCLCSAQPPYTATQGLDCNDDDKAVRPTAVEVCNGKDDDCDGVTDPPNTMGGKPYYKDIDGDGYGSGTDYQVRCTPGDQYTSLRNDDCLDSDKEVYPGATEYCNAKDDDCDGTIDEEGSVGCNKFFYDQDGDGYGLTAKMQCRCGGTPSGYYRASKDGDCDDGNVQIKPGASEICFNLIDDNCNGSTDEEGGYGCTQYYIDLDGDGYSPDPNNWKCLCTAVTPYVGTDATGDCCDRDARVKPNQANYYTSTNSCGNFDYDCNGTPDKQYRSQVRCSGTFGNCNTVPGWADSIPECGQTAGWSDECTGFLGLACEGDTTSNRTQPCK